MLYGGTPGRTWLMSHSERCALLHVLRHSTRGGAAALEIGTAHGGCLEHIRQHAAFTVSIDIDPAVSARLASTMPGVDFLVGDSAVLIGDGLKRCAARGLPLGFVLIDGDHSRAGVERDIHAVLQHVPTQPTWVLMHDSSNPECRAGIAGARWADSPHVHCVDLDFVPGTLSEDPQFEGMIWGGLALALMLPERRSGALTLQSSGPRTYDAIYQTSEHPPTLANSFRRWWRIKRRGLQRRLG